MKLASIVIILAFSCAALGDHDHKSPCKVCHEPNTEFRLCGDDNPRTCENMHSKLPCPPICRPGCYCKKGYVRESVSGRCILPCECPKPAPKPHCGCPHSHHPEPRDYYKYPTPCDGHEKPSPCNCHEKPSPCDCHQKPSPCDCHKKPSECDCHKKSVQCCHDRH